MGTLRCCCGPVASASSPGRIWRHWSRARGSHGHQHAERQRGSACVLPFDHSPLRLDQCAGVRAHGGLSMPTGGAQATKMQNGCQAKSANTYKGSSGSSLRSSRITAPRATARCRCRCRCRSSSARLGSARLGIVKSRCNCRGTPDGCGRCQAAWSRSSRVSVLVFSGRLMPTMSAGAGVVGWLRNRSGCAA